MTFALTIGADPEVFVKKDGMIDSVIGHLGGSKEEPLEVQDGAVQEDNVLAEFNITPASSSGEMIGKIRSVMKQMADMLTPKGYELEVVTSHKFKRSQLSQYGPAALVFGCDPDFNAWLGGEQNPTPNSGSSLRTAGGHVHVGSLPDNADVLSCVCAMDVYLGIPSVLMDDDTKRRRMYGKAGAYRVKPYGFEYRSLSNFWIKEDATIEWVYNQTHKAIQAAMDGSLDYLVLKYGSEELQRIMNESDKEAAAAIIEAEGL